MGSDTNKEPSYELQGRPSVRPLPAFESFFQAGRPRGIDREALLAVVNRLAKSERRLVADYLAAGATAAAIMGVSEDILGGRFIAIGGPGVQTDGTYFWRTDVAEYVRWYGIDIGEEAVEHMRRLDWRTPELSEDEYLAIGSYLHGIEWTTWTQSGEGERSQPG